MNNNNPTGDNGSPPDDSLWAEIVERQGEPMPTNSPETEPAEQFELTAEMLDDLELDGQLKVLGKISSPEDAFVDQVISQAHSQSNPSTPANHGLTVFEPTFGTRPEASPESAEVSSTDQSSEETGVELNSHPAPARFLDFQTAALVAGVAATFLFGCFVGGTWFDSSNNNVKKTGASPVNSEQTVDLEGDIQFAKSEDPDSQVASNDIDSNFENISDPDSSDVDPLTALLEEIDREKLSNLLDDADGGKLNRPLVDSDKKVELAGDIDREKRPRASLKNPEDLKVEASPNGLPWDSKFEWNLAVQFGRNGLGTVALNGQRIQAIVLQDNTVFLLRGIVDEIKRRVEYLDTRLGTGINGSIQIGDSRFSFENVSQLDQALDKVDRHVAKLPVRSLGIDELMSLRGKYRQGIHANFRKFKAINLTSKNGSFYTEDEAFTICSVLSTSETIWRDLARKRLDWEKSAEIPPTVPSLVKSVSAKTLEYFADSGILLLPDSSSSANSLASIQKLGPSELALMLQDAPSLELFRNFQEFQAAKDFVYSKGPPEMQLRLTIDKNERKLEQRYPPLSDTMVEMIEIQNSHLTKQLRSAGVSIAGDSEAMEPLKGLLAKRTDLQSLPLVMGKECKSDHPETIDLGNVSKSLGQTINRFNGSLGSRDAAQNDALRNLSIKQMVAYCMEEHVKDRLGNYDGNPSSQKLKTVDQILQIDHPRLRLEFVDKLRKSDSAVAVKLLVNKAKFDLVPEVRTAAIDALAEIAPEKYRKLLLEGFSYPWHVVAEHSAEALVRLNDQDSIPELIKMLDMPHPHFPVTVNGQLVQRELVGINHMRNCLLCHAPSVSSEDSTRGLVPHSTRPLPAHYYTGRDGDPVPFAVRADITYLEQDFSVVQPVANPGPWPRDQRFDYVVRSKKVTPAQAASTAQRISQTPNRYRNAIIFALRQLTGEEPADNSSSNWKKIMSSR